MLPILTGTKEFGPKCLYYQLGFKILAFSLLRIGCWGLDFKSIR